MLARITDCMLFKWIVQRVIFFLAQAIAEVLVAAPASRGEAAVRLTEEPSHSIPARTAYDISKIKTTIINQDTYY
jgi:hypothetical protein